MGRQQGRVYRDLNHKMLVVLCCVMMSSLLYGKESNPLFSVTPKVELVYDRERKNLVNKTSFSQRYNSSRYLSGYTTLDSGGLLLIVL